MRVRVKRVTEIGGSRMMKVTIDSVRLTILRSEWSTALCKGRDRRPGEKSDSRLIQNLDKVEIFLSEDLREFKSGFRWETQLPCSSLKAIASNMKKVRFGSHEDEKNRRVTCEGRGRRENTDRFSKMSAFSWSLIASRRLWVRIEYSFTTGGIWKKSYRNWWEQEWEWKKKSYILRKQSIERHQMANIGFHSERIGFGRLEPQFHRKTHLRP